MKRFTSLILGVVLLFGALKAYILFRDSEPTPRQAIEMYVARASKNAPRKAEAINIVSAVPSDKGKTQTLLFRATEQPTQIHMAGYAILKKTVFGWYVDRLQMAGKSPLPDDVMANVEWLEGAPVIFGQVFLPNAVKVEAVFDDPNQGQITKSGEIPDGNFVLFGSRFNELTELRILDSSGKTLKKFSSDELD